MTPNRTQTSLLTVALAATVTHAVIPYGSSARPVVKLVVALAVIACTVWALRRLEARARGPWLFIAAGLFTSATADVLLATWRLTATVVAYPNPVHLLYLVASGLFAVGVTRLVRQGRSRHLASLLDAAIAATGVLTLIWVLVLMTDVASMPEGLVARLHAVVHPVIHVVLLFAAVRLLLHSRRTRAVTLLVGAVLAYVALATVVGLLTVTGGFVPGTAFGGVWAVVYALFLLALLEIDASEVPRPSEEPRTDVAPIRAVWMFAAALLLPATMLFTARDDRDVTLAVMTTALLVLVMTRMWMLLRELSGSVDLKVAAQVQRDERRFSALVRHMSDVLLVVDEDGTVTFASPSAEGLYGTDPTGWSVKDLIDYLHPSEKRPTVGAVIDRINHGNAQPVRINARMRDDGEGERYIDITAVDLRHDPDVGGVVLTTKETTERNELIRQVRELALHDALTGLGNRELFSDRLEHALARTARAGSRVAVLMCDLDDFKDINDTLGHAVGDRVLVEVARRLQGAVRHADTISRLGGDEFGVLVEDIEASRDAAMAARRLLAVTNEPIEVDGHDLRVGMSIGVLVDTGERTSEEVLRDADIALYEAKGQGKRRWAFHRTTMTIRNQARLQLTDDLAHALADGDLEIAYQTVSDIRMDRVVGVEALVRWEHPTRGPLMPADFLEIAERSGLVTAIGHHLLDEALRTLRRCLDARPGLVLRVAVNVSARELREPALVDHVVTALARHRIDPQMLVLEITESSMFDDTTLSLSVMHRLREHGVRFAVDDFGTGYSSLSYLRKLPVDIIKIDRSFVQDLGEDDTSADLVRAIVELGRTLSLDVCAEGVERPDQREILMELGCVFAQGYHYGQPLTDQELLELVTTQRLPMVVTEEA